MVQPPFLETHIHGIFIYGILKGSFPKQNFPKVFCCWKDSRIPTQKSPHFVSPFTKWVFPKIGVPQNGWCIMENPIKMDDLKVPQFSETSKSFDVWKWSKGDSSNTCAACSTGTETGGGWVVVERQAVGGLLKSAMMIQSTQPVS